MRRATKLAEYDRREASSDALGAGRTEGALRAAWSLPRAILSSCRGLNRFQARPYGDAPQVVHRFRCGDRPPGLLGSRPADRACTDARGGAGAAVEQHIVPRLVSSPRPAPGVRVRVLRGPVPGILLEADAAPFPVTVFGPQGEPYARIGARGVQISMASAGPPRWRWIGRQPRHSWLKPRAPFPASRLSDDVLTSTRPRTLMAWRIPLDVAGRRSELQGETRWLPEPGASEPSGILSSFGGPIVVLSGVTACCGGFVGRC